MRHKEAVASMVHDNSYDIKLTIGIKDRIVATNGGRKDGIFRTFGSPTRETAYKLLFGTLKYYLCYLNDVSLLYGLDEHLEKTNGVFFSLEEISAKITTNGGYELIDTVNDGENTDNSFSPLIIDLNGHPHNIPDGNVNISNLSRIDGERKRRGDTNMRKLKRYGCAFCQSEKCVKKIINESESYLFIDPKENTIHTLLIFECKDNEKNGKQIFIRSSSAKERCFLCNTNSNRSEINYVKTTHDGICYERTLVSCATCKNLKEIDFVEIDDETYREKTKTYS